MRQATANRYVARVIAAFLTSTAAVAAHAQQTTDAPAAPPPSGPTTIVPKDAVPPNAPAGTTNNQTAGVADIIITAQRREERLQRVPIAVQIVSPKQIETAGIESTLDLPRVAPGVTTAPTAANSFFIPYIRGVGSNSPATGNDSSIATYIDGVYQSDKAANVFDFSDIERLEVLKGPQGTLFGRNATGGAVNIITRQPSFAWQGWGELSYARFNRFVGKAYVGGPLASTLAFNASYEHIGGGDFARNTGPIAPGKFGGTHSDAISAKLLFQPNDRFSMTVGASYINRRTTDLNSNLNPVPGTTPVGALLGGIWDPRLYHYAGAPNLFAVRAFRATARLRYSFDNFDLVSITGYVHTSDTNRLDFDGTSANVLYFNEKQGTKDFSQELQLLSTGTAPLQWVLGLYYSHNTARIDPLNLLQGAPYNATLNSFPNGTVIPGGSITSIEARGPTRSLAAYGQATYAITPTTKFTAGLRYTIERRGYDFAVSGVGQIAPGFFSPVVIPLVSDEGNLRKTFKKPSWRLAIDHQFTPDILGYVSYNRGFKSGTYNLNDFTPGQIPVRPEQLDAYEAGVKSRFANRTVQLNLASFFYNYKNIQLDTIVASGSGASTTVLQNAASEHIYGLDADFIYQPYRDLSLTASGSLLHAKYQSFPHAVAFIPDAFGNGAQSEIDASGMRGLYAPKWSFTLGANYTAHISSSALDFNASYFRTAAFKVGIGPEDRVNEYDSLGASITYRAPGDRYYVRVFGNNLTNQKDLGTSLSAVKASRQEIVPRTYGIALGTHF